jgi:hypothetical protein
MNMFRKIVFTLTFAMGTLLMSAQNVIDLSSYIDEATAAQLGESNSTALLNKISKIITRNGMADAAGLFAVVPTITITNDNKVDTGMTEVRVLRADVTLSVKNLFENTVYGSQTVRLQTQGKNKEDCMRSLINKINVNDARFAKLIKDVQQSIADYYSRQMPIILAKINSLVARGEYEDAMAVLAVIPENVAEYQTVSDLKVEVYNKMLSKEIERTVAESEILVRQGDIDGALNLCRAANPASPNYGEVIAFMRRLDAEAAAVEAAQAEQQMRKMDVQTIQETVKKEAVEEAKILKAERAESSAKKGKSLGAWLFGL